MPLRLQDELSPHAGLLEEEINHTLDRGSRVAAILGVSCGLLMVLGAIGSTDRKDFTVIGNTVNTASRVKDLCKEFGRPILVTGAVHGQLSPESRGKCTPLGDSSVKGKLESVQVFSAAE